MSTTAADVTINDKKPKKGIIMSELTPEQQEARRATLRKASAKFRANNLELSRERVRNAVRELYHRSPEYREYKNLCKRVYRAEKALEKYTNVPQV